MERPYYRFRYNECVRQFYLHKHITNAISSTYTFLEVGWLRRIRVVAGPRSGKYAVSPSVGFGNKKVIARVGSPQHPPDTIGIVAERVRPPDEMEHLVTELERVINEQREEFLRKWHEYFP